MDDALSEAVEGLVKFTNDYVSKVQQELKVTTDKISTGTFAMEDAFQSMLRLGSLWMTGLAGAAVEGMDFATTLTKYLGTRTIVSQPYKVGAAGAWTLALTGPLTDGQQEVLDPAVVTVEPAQVADGLTDTFVIKAVVQQVGGGIYGGTVTATSPNGKVKPKSVQVKLQVG
jgi:hypothetical protein